MVQITPSNLKEAAKKFTEKYYPQWLSRTDRIWEMMENIDPNSLQNKSANSQCQQGNTFGIAGEAEPQFKDYMSGVAVFAFACKNIQGTDNISKDEINEEISIIQMNLNISAGLQAKLENVLSEILPALFNNAAEHPKHGQAFNNTTSRNDTREFVVYLARPSGFGTDKYFVTEEELHSKYLSNKMKYDLVVYLNNIEIKSVIVRNGVEEITFKSIEMYPNVLNLLTLFLKYKNEPLSFSDLYQCAWEHSGYKVKISDSDQMVENLKHAVSILRNLKNNVDGFNIPYAKRDEGTYVCKGHFQFCLVLKKSADQRYTLEVN